MNIGFSKLIGAGVFFLLIFVTGFWLSRTGRPYSAVWFNIHKLIALAALVFLLIMYIQAHKGSSITQLEWGVAILTLACFAATIISGGLLNLEKPLPAFLLVMHRVLPLLTLLGAAVSLLLTRSSGLAVLH